MTDSVIVPITDKSLRHEEEASDDREWPAEERLREALSGVEGLFAGVPRPASRVKPRAMM